jgi:nucleoid-associated protein YgaU
MKTIKLAILPAADNEVVSATLSIQRKKGDSWTVDEVITIISGQPGAERTLLLDDSQRIVVEGTSNIETVFDKEQSAAVTRTVTRTLVGPTPVSDDGVEGDTPFTKTSAAALAGVGFAEAQAEERRAAAVTAARERLQQQQAEQRMAEERKAPSTEPTQKVIDPGHVDGPGPEPKATTSHTKPPQFGF